MQNPPSNMAQNILEMTCVAAIMKRWEDEHNQPNFSPVPILKRLTEIIEAETENYLKMDPDPFDERHPSRADPECQLGHVLKVIFKKENFMNKLVKDYLRDTYYSRLNVSGQDVDELNIAACRLMLDLMPGLETSAVFQPDMDGLIHRLIKWSKHSVEPLQSYATGLLAAAMEVPEIATRFREQNVELVPLMLQRLRKLQMSSDIVKTNISSRPFAHFANLQKSPPQNEYINSFNSPPPSVNKKESSCSVTKEENGFLSPVSRSPFMSPERDHCFDNGTKLENTIPPENDKTLESSQRKKRKLSHGAESPHPAQSPFKNETSNSSWAELESYLIGNVQIFPPTTYTKQILILRYLTPIGEYQEFLSHIFENNAIELILNYANVREHKQSRLAFEALKFLASLLCHKKFSIEFINGSGLQRLLEVPRPSIAATGVSICLYYLAYCEEAMERVCLLPQYVINNLVKYALWLLECSHDSGRCHATMFFGLTFQFRIILEEFDQQDGLRKLHNVISTLPILSLEDEVQLNDDAECAARQIVRHVCVAYKRYLEAHLFIKAEQLRRTQLRPSERGQQQMSFKAAKSTPEEIQQQIETLLQFMPFRAHWPPVDQLLKLGGITLLLQIIAFAYEWNYSGRAETVRSALDTLAIGCVMPKVQSLFCERVELPEEAITVGINIILGAADGDIVADADVQKSALNVIVNCVCAPINRVGGTIARFGGESASPAKKTKFRNSEELIQKVWDSVRSNSGIMVLLQLMNVKTPITDADSIRTLACKALAGLARSDTVRQIVSKLPLFTNGQLQNLMRDPILQEKRQEHVSFQKYALELLERLSGNTKHSGTDMLVSLANIHRANVVAQTKIQFNDKQLLQLIHQHLISHDLTETANNLLREANLGMPIHTQNGALTPTPFRYTNTINRPRLSFVTPRGSQLTSSSQSISRCLIPPQTDSPSTSYNYAHVNALNNGSNSILTNGATSNASSIKITRKNTSVPSASVSQNSRLQKQIVNEPPTHSTPSKALVEDFGSGNAETQVTLRSIITEYLTNQHALCKNPMATCPQFNLFVPHKCPDPKPRSTLANNFTMRFAQRQLGYQSKALDRRLLHSRFCPVQTIRLPTEDGFFTCAKFMPPSDQSIVVGDYSGKIHLFNMHTGTEEGSFQAHDCYIVHLEPNRDGTLLLTSSTWGQPISGLWNVCSGGNYDMKVPLNDEYIEFSKVNQDRILGTKGEVATIYDTATGTKITQLHPTSSNQYTKNKATFSPTDELILSDGVLWDVNSNTQIHKLDKLNQTQSGIFHPNGLEILSNTEVWDIRTFHLLKTVPTLNQSQVLFSPVNNAIYGIAIEQETEEDQSFDSSFKTLDAMDYTSIATIDVKRNIYDLAVNRYDSQIAIVENQGLYHSVQESVVRIYDVGRRRDDEDEQDEDEDDEEDMDGSDDGSGSNSDDGGDLLEQVLAESNDDENNDGDEGQEEGGDDEDDESDDDSDWTDQSEDSEDDPNYSPSTSGGSDIVELLLS